MILIGLALMWLGLRQPVTVLVDGEEIRIQTSAVTVNGALRVAEVSAGPDDWVIPSRGRWFWKSGVIQVISARDVTIRTPEYEVVFTSAEPIPANLILESDIFLYPHDRLLADGEVVDPEAPLEDSAGVIIEYVPAIQVTLEIDGEVILFYTGEETLGEALMAEGIEIGVDDWVSVSLSTVISEPITAAVRRPRSVTVIAQGNSVTGMTAFPTVGEALLDLGVPLQNLDYSLPAESEAVPEDGQITVVRVREDIQVVTEEIAHEYEYQDEPDPDMPLDQTFIVQEGQNAIFAARERIHYEDGEEVWRVSEDTWQASEQQTEIVGYGSQVVVQTAVVDGQTLEYYRKLTVWTTTYRPCDEYGNCYYYTSNQSKVDIGVIGVPTSWYYLLANLPVYVTDYGYATIADVCPGCVGEYWIDLGYSEENYDDLHLDNAWRAIYFLTPVPSYVPALLP